MNRSRREYSLAKEQPIIQRARRRSHANAESRSEADFWLLFDLEKFACDWQREFRRRALE